MQSDPSPGDISAPTSIINKYIYGGNNPLSNLDPSGRSLLGDVLIDVGIAAVVIVTTVLSGGTATGAIYAILGVAGGALVAASAYATAVSAVTGDWSSFGSTLGSAFQTDFLIGSAFLGGSIIAADIWGGGVITAGGNLINGWVESEDSVAFEGGLTVGPTTFFSGVLPSESNGAVIYGAHELGHTIQLIGLSALGGLTKSQGSSWAAYAAFGALGAIAPSGAGAWWENSASTLGGGIYDY